MLKYLATSLISLFLISGSLLCAGSDEIIESQDVSVLLQGQYSLAGGAASLHAPSALSQLDRLDKNALLRQGTPRTNIPTLISVYNKTLSSEQIISLSHSIHLLSQYFQIDPHLIASIIAVESSFRPAAISKTGAIGLGQLKPKTAAWLGVRNPYDPVQNMAGVAKYTRFLMDKYQGSLPHVLAAYFVGQGTVDRHGIDSGSQYYIGKVQQVMSTFF
jgi:soluble lytic murein transglycosylase-like protein